MFDSRNIFFTTASINKWIHLLQEDEYKDILISSLKFLSQNRRLCVYAFVIMPNHFHVIWSEGEDKMKETAKASFFKFTSKKFLDRLTKHDHVLLRKFLVDKKDRKYQFWQRSSLDIEIYSEQIFEQKMNYIHNNPLQPRWNLVENPVEYKYSSARYFEKGIDEFGLLTDYYFGWF